MAKGLRPSRCYHWDSPAFTRISKNPSASFITGIPGNKIFHFTMGNPLREYNTEVSIVAEQRIQMRHNALEAARVAANKKLESDVGAKNYLYKVRVYPHHVMRENAQASGAGADRVQQGMRKSYGKPVGRAARVQADQKVMSVYADTAGDEDLTLRTVKKALKMAMLKLPGELRLSIERKAS